MFLCSLTVYGPEGRHQCTFMLEFYVVFVNLTTFCSQMIRTHLRFELDVMTKVTYLSHRGAGRSIAPDSVARKIWEWCIPSHVPGSVNVVADSLSKKHNSDHEWQLNPEAFYRLYQLFVPFNIDLFATALNAQLAQLPRFATWRPDSDREAAFFDAFTRLSANEYFYGIPPFSLIYKCLDKIETDQAEGLILVPARATQTWYTYVLQMLS